MLTLDVLDSIKLTPRPAGQIAVGSLLRANYRFPGTRTEIRIEGLDRLPTGGRVYIAMNHTDRYNYWPFQTELWKLRDQFTATWVKGKYYNSAVMSRFMVATNNIPAPSRGYLIAVDATAVLGHSPPDALYRVLRDAHDQGQSFDEARDRAEEVGVAAEFRRMNETGRDMLGLEYDPAQTNFLDAQRDLFFRMMDRFIRLNDDAFDLGLKIIVFPEGTRSRRLGTGRPGLAQMAVRTGATIVPVGCNGSDEAYPGNSPVSRGGSILYRVGEPLTPEGELADYQVKEAFRPFTSEADAHADKFAGLTDLVMQSIEELLDERYRPAPDARPEVDGLGRFL